MVTRGVSQPPFSFIFAEAPLILCKEDLEIYIHSLFNRQKVPFGKSPGQSKWYTPGVGEYKWGNKPDKLDLTSLLCQ